MFINQYPYTDFNELNLDWILSIIKRQQDWFENELPELVHELKFAEDQIQALQDWIDNFDVNLITDALNKYFKVAIFVGINDNGYIVYYIPETWDEIVFNTTELDISIPGYDYGHLVLSY